MKISIKEANNCQKILQVEVPKEDIAVEFDNFYERIQNQAQVPGFRKGKAPRNILEQHFAHRAEEEVLTHLIKEYYQKAIEKEQIHPVDVPQISNINFKKSEKLSFQATVDVRPKFNLKTYKGLKIKKKNLAVKDEEINKVLNFLQERYAQFLPIEKRPVQKDDYIICDYNYSVEGKVVEKKDRVWLWVNEKLFIPGLLQQLEGINPQEKKEFDLELPEHYHPKELAKKIAHFDFLVKEIKEKKLPELNEEFAKTLGKNSLEELKNQMKEDLIKEKEAISKQEMKDQLIEQLVKAMPLDVPGSLVNKREELLKETTRQKLKRQGLNEEQIKEEEKQLENVFKQEALKQIRTFFILEEISEKENINIEEEELNKRVEAIAQVYQQKKEDVLEYLSKNNMLENLRWELWEEKVISFLVEHAKIEDMQAD